MENNKPLTTIGILCGPTACGKTAASIGVAQRLQGEIISADSIQIYRGMDIGSAKPTMEERMGIAHHMLDIVEVNDPSFSVSVFKQKAFQYIEEIHSRGHFPLVVGGTGLYINALSYPLDFTAVPGDPAVRQQLQEKEAQYPGSSYQRLQQVDPISAARLHPNDLKRIIRALEVYVISGRTLTSYGNDFANAKDKPMPYQCIMVGLTMAREKLYARIEQRVDQMMQAGLLEETRRFYEAGYDPKLPALQGLGYKQLYRYFQGEISLEQAISDIKQETRHFAKRQWTWFRRDQRIHWIDVDAYKGLQDLIEGIIRIFQTGSEEGGHGIR